MLDLKIWWPVLLIVLSFLVVRAKKWRTAKTRQSCFASPEPFCVQSDKDLAFLIPLQKEEIDALVLAVRARIKDGLRQILALAPRKRTFKNTVLQFDYLRDQFAVDQSRIDLLGYVHPNQQIMIYASQQAVALLNYANDELMTSQVYQVFKQFQEDHGAKLSEEQNYLLAKIIQDLAYAGCALDQASLATFKDLEKKANEKSVAFEQNIAMDTPMLSCTREELSGISERLLAMLPKNKDGLFEVRIDAPTYVEILRNCENSNTRMQVYHLFMNRAYPANEALLLEIFNLRHAMAQLLGYPDYAHCSLADKMAENPTQVADFLGEVKNKVAAAAKEEFAEVANDLPSGVVVGDDGLIQPWDYEFLCNYHLKKHLQVDKNLIAEYFTLDTTLRGIFALYSRMLGIHLELMPAEESNNYHLWHPDVKLMKAYDGQRKQVLGYILLDLHPRQNKYTHACCGMLLAGVKNELVNQLPVMFVLANFQKPDANGMVLLAHEEVKTFFHEFGHAMHNLLAVTKYAYFSGTRVLMDFVETPSQMFEEYMYDPQVLKLISAHYQTGKPLPLELVEGLRKQQRFMLGNFILRQLRLALFSLKCYLAEPFVSIKALEESVALLIPTSHRYSPNTHFYASFGHLTSYGAGYYSYLWALVFAKELWLSVEKLGVLTPEAGALVAKLLRTGGMLPPKELLTQVLGHEPSVAAFEQFLGRRRNS